MLRKMRFISLVGLLSITIGCTGQQPKRSDCEQTYALGVLACDTAITDEKQHAQCVAAVKAVELACFIAATPDEPEPAPTATESTEVRHTTRAERWAEGLALMRDGRMTPAEFEAYVLAK